MEIKSFKILYDNILIKPIKEADKAFGLEIPQQYEEKPQLGEVISVGEGRLMEDGSLVPLRIKAGDMILFNKYSTTVFTLEGVEYLVLREEDVIGYVSA